MGEVPAPGRKSSAPKTSMNTITTRTPMSRRRKRRISERRMSNPRSVFGVAAFAQLIEGMGGVCVALLALLIATPALAEKGKLRERLTPEVMAVVYPGAERLGPEEGNPPAIAVYKGDKIVAYV